MLLLLSPIYTSTTYKAALTIPLPCFTLKLPLPHRVILNQSTVNLPTLNLLTVQFPLLHPDSQLITLSLIKFGLPHIILNLLLNILLMQLTNLLHLLLNRMSRQVVLVITIHHLRYRTQHQTEILLLPLILILVLVLLRLVLLYLLVQQNLVTVRLLYQLIIGLL
jgi:hypothetical protein